MALEDDLEFVGEDCLHALHRVELHELGLVLPPPKAPEATVGLQEVGLELFVAKVDQVGGERIKLIVGLLHQLAVNRLQVPHDSPQDLSLLLPVLAAARENILHQLQEVLAGPAHLGQLLAPVEHQSQDPELLFGIALFEEGEEESLGVVADSLHTGLDEVVVEEHLEAALGRLGPLVFNIHRLRTLK